MLGWMWRARWYLIVVAVLAGVFVVRHVRGSVHEVMVTEAIEGPLHRRIAASGLVEAESADLAFRGNGEITNLYADEGDSVTRSQILARIARIDLLTPAADSGDVIRAPYDGSVVDVYLRTGSVVAAGMPVLRVASSARPWVTAFIDSEDALYVSPGDRFKCRVGGYLSEPWDAVVRSVGKEAVPRRDLLGSAHQVRVRCEIPVGTQAVAACTEVDVDGDVRIVDWGVLIPASAVLHEGPDNWTWVVEGNSVKRRAVTPGPNNFDYIEISDGLSAGETVVVKGKEGLEDGMAVRVGPMPPMTEAASGGV